MHLLRRLMFCIPDDGDGSGAPGAGSGGGGGADPKAGDGAPPVPPSDPGKAFTQAELDRIVGDRLAREKKNWEKDAEEKRKRDQMAEGDRLKAEKDEADKKATDAVNSANKIKIEAKAEVALLAAGVKPERLLHALRLLTLDDITVKEDGKPDAAAIKAAVDALVKDFPEIVGQQGPGKGGADFSSGSSSGDVPLTEESILKMTDAEVGRRQAEIKAFYAKRK